MLARAFSVMAALTWGVVAFSRPAAAQAPLQPSPAIQAVLDEGRKLERENKLLEAASLYSPALETARSASDRKGEGVLLLRLGILSGRGSRHAEAIAFYEKAILIGRELDDRLVLAAALKSMGGSRYSLGEPAKAMELFREALPLWEALGDRAQVAGTLMNMGVVLENTGDPRGALEIYNRTLPAFRDAKDRLGEAHALLNIAKALNTTGKPDEAQPLLQEALVIYRELNLKADQANVTAALASRHKSLGDIPKAIELHTQSLALARDAGSRGAEAQALSNLGNIYADFGQPERAVSLFEQSLAIRKAFKDIRGEAHSSRSLGNLYSRTGRSRQGLELLEQALALYRRLKDPQGEAITLSEIAYANVEVHQVDAARSYFEQSRVIMDQLGNKHGQAQVLNGLAVLLRDQGRPRPAIDNYRQALALILPLGSKNSTAALYGNFASAYHELRKPAEARLHALKALALYREVGDQHGIATSLASLGDVARDAGKQADARGYFGQALTAARAARNRSREAELLHKLGRAELALRQVNRSTVYFGQAVEAAEGLRSDIGGYADSRASSLAARLSYYYDYMRALLRQGRDQEAFAVAQKTKARSLLDLLQSGRVDLDASLSPEEKAQEQDLILEASALNAAMVKQGVENEVGSRKRYEALKVRLKEVESKLNVLRGSLYARHPQLAQGRVARTTTLEEAARLLPADTALLDYVVTAKDDVRLFLVTRSRGRTRLVVRKVARDYPGLAAAAGKLHAACADPRKPYRALSGRLYAQLVQPIQAELRGKNRLIICPDGALWEVPFQALTSARSRSGFLGDRFTIAYAYSATGAQAAIRLSARKRTSPAGSILVAANPAFGALDRFGDLYGLPGQRPIDSASRPIDSASRPIDSASRPIDSASRPIDSASRPIDSASRPIDSASRPIDSASRPIDVASRALQAVSATRGGGSARGNAIPPLPGTQREADMLRKLLPGAQILTGDQAQEATFKRLAANYRYLHLATHGFVNDGSPLLSSVVLARPTLPAAGGTAEDGFLTAREIYGLNLNAEMAVLSACNTARGENRTGEGVIGLTWALFVAGCPTQVVSQWAVDDASTAMLMGRFYENLQNRRMGKAQALREAGTWLRGRKRKYAHPYYWAPFVLNGAWN